MALSRVHTSTKAADMAKLILLNTDWNRWMDDILPCGVWQCHNLTITLTRHQSWANYWLHLVTNY